MLRQLFKAINQPRFWVLFAGAFLRGAGFATSFLLSRISGAVSLGEYSKLVNTASTVIQPFLRAMQNNSTLLAADAHGRNEVAVRHIVSANLSLAVTLSIVALLLFLGLEYLVLNDTGAPISISLTIVAASCFIFGHLLGAVLVGSFDGTGRFVEAARISVIISILVVALSIPAILLWGLVGAYATLCLAAIVPPLILGSRLFRNRHRSASTKILHKDAMERATTQLRESLPTVIAVAIGAVALWYCTVYLVQDSFGVEGIGVVAVAMQWLAPMLLAEASWGGISIRTLTDAFNSGNPMIVRKTVLDLLRRNVSITFVVALGTILGADWIAGVYRLGNSDLALLIRLNAACAVVLACNNVFQYLFLCLRRQGEWFLISAVRFIVQISITSIFVKNGLFVIMLGALAGAVVQTLFCALRGDKLIRHAPTLRN